jgi:hypothetical protein
MGNPVLPKNKFRFWFWNQFQKPDPVPFCFLLIGTELAVLIGVGWFLPYMKNLQFRLYKNNIRMDVVLVLVLKIRPSHDSWSQIDSYPVG